MRFASQGGFFELNAFPGCNQLVVSNHAFIPLSDRTQGLGQLQHQERLGKARELGYDCIICTVVSGNARQKHILTKYGWAKVWQFTNSETTNIVEVWAKNLKE